VFRRAGCRRQAARLAQPRRTSAVLALAQTKGPLGHLVEGMFSYLDVSLVLLTAMVFMKVIEANGLAGGADPRPSSRCSAGRGCCSSSRSPSSSCSAMITGSCTASVLGTGVIVAPVLMRMGLPRATTGAVISSAAVYGMIAPP